MIVVINTYYHSKLYTSKYILVLMLWMSTYESL